MLVCRRIRRIEQLSKGLKAFGSEDMTPKESEDTFADPLFTDVDSGRVAIWNERAGTPVSPASVEMHAASLTALHPQPAQAAFDEGAQAVGILGP
jgi:hypothetical protein